MKNELTFLKEDVEKLIKKALSKKIFSGGAVGIFFKNGKKIKKYKACYGNVSYSSSHIITPSTFFDLASLTKPLATVLAVLSLIKEKRLSLDGNVYEYFENNIPREKRDIKIRHLLGHCSGLSAYKPYYKELKKYPLFDRKKKICRYIINENLEYIPQTKTVYSDLGFILLDSIIEKITGNSLEIYIQEKFKEFHGSTRGVIFNPLKKNIKNCAATENCLWRKKTLCGEVHDENTFSVGGSSGQAGLFGTIDGVLRITSHVLDIWTGNEENKNIESDQLRYFLKSKSVKNSSWVVGFDTPSPGYSSGGKYLSRNSVGHLGFTGTSFWIDPERELVIVLLTNRIHPTRNNEMIREFRPLFHDTVIESLGLV